MKYSKIIIAVVAACALGAIVYYLSRDGANTQPTETVQNTPAQTSPNGTPASPAPEQAPPLSSSLEKAEDSDTLKKIHEILLSASEYYNDTKNSTVIISQNGFLYNAAADIVVTPEYLVSREYLSSDYTVDGATVLLLIPDGVSEIIPLEDYSNDMKLYVAAPHEGGYIIDTKGWEAVKISNDDFSRILDAYNVNHGEIRRITGSSPEYPEINSVLKEYESSASDFFIRYGMRDDKYAVVIASPKDRYDEIRQYVLECESGSWKIRIPNLESVKKTKLVVNSVCPDLDASLLPDFNLIDYQGYMTKDFSGVSEKLIEDGYLAEKDAVLKYISATDKFMFLKYENGQMFLAVKPEDIWILGEVDSPENALARFKGIEDRPPEFIIIWE